jgi:hypothetical protein
MPTNRYADSRTNGFTRLISGLLLAASKVLDCGNCLPEDLVLSLIISFTVIIRCYVGVFLLCAKANGFDYESGGIFVAPRPQRTVGQKRFEV